jgi:hypothetical protein
MSKSVLDPGEFRLGSRRQTAIYPPAVICKLIPSPIVDPERGAGKHDVSGQGGKSIIDQGVPCCEVGGSVIARGDSGPDRNEEEPDEGDPDLGPTDVLAVAGDGGFALKGTAGGRSENISAAAGEVEDDVSVTGQVEH